MSDTKSFDAGVAAVAEDAEPHTAASMSPRPAAEMAKHINQMDDFEGEFQRSDILTPRMSFVGSSQSPLADDFPVGSWVLNKSLAVAAKDDELPMTVVKATKTYRERTDYDSDDIGRVFRTRDDAAAAGLRIDWDELNGERLAPQIDESLTLLALIRGDVDAPEFCLSHDGVRYALVVYTISGYRAYDAVARPLLTARTMYLPRFCAREFMLTSKEFSVQKTGKKIRVPALLRGAATSDAFQSWASNLV